MRDLKIVGASMLALGVSLLLIGMAVLIGGGSLSLVTSIVVTAIPLTLAGAACIRAAFIVSQIEDKFEEINQAIKEYLESNYGEDRQEQEVEILWR